jgi:ubiquinone/menaquinone biosynthesis C-methylase UbiE
MLSSDRPVTQKARPGYLNFDSVADSYDATRGIPPEAQEQAALIVRENAVLAPGEKIFDAGVGTGRFALPLARLGVPVVGVDVSVGMLGRLREKLSGESPQTRASLRLARGDLRRIPMRSSAFKAVLVVHILHLIEDWKAVVQEVRRILLPGGVLFLVTDRGRTMLPTRDHYFERARTRGLLREHIGVAVFEELQAYLEAQGAEVQRVDEERVRWMAQEKVGTTLEMLERRTWSNLWPIPEADHAELLRETTDWALAQYGSLDAVEESETKMVIRAVRWPK